ncbi:MAG: condensation domain-containing protein, partial [Cyanobacteria bacterium P01_A01_bin.80]
MKSKLNKTSRQNIEDIYPLSPMQQGMLFHSLYTPESEVYFIQFSCSLTGKVDVPTFEQAWQKIVEKYSIFRTAFVWESSSQPMQVVYRQVQITVESYDWQELSENEQQQQLETFLESDRQKPLPLSQAPLMRLYLIKLDKDNYQFVWSHHHLLLDGWSFPLVFKNLVEFYQLISLGETFSYQPVPSYRNYISWLQRQDKELAEKFWKQKLQGFSAPTPLEVDKRLSNAETNSKNNSKTDNKTKSISFGEKQIQLTESTTTALGSFARVHHLTLNNLVQATWGLLLSRYSQETDVVFGATVSGRPPSIPGIESMVGLFINTLPMRVTVSADTPVLSLLKDLQTQQIEFDQYSYSSLAEIQSWSDIPGGTSLFETIVVFENFPFDTKLKSDTASFEFGNRRVFQQTNYPLTLIVLPHQNFLVKINYDTSKFDDATITRMLGHFQTLLAGMIADPMQPISKLPLLTEIEKQQLLIDWNHTPANYSSDKCIHQLFEEQVEKTPNEIAVVFPSLQDSQEKQQLTYHQLNSRANQLANYLHQNHQIKPNTLIGICVERSLEMIVGILGILKAGGAYIPLDPEYPRERLSFMLEDSQISVLLTQQQFVESLPNHQEQIICLDTEWETIAQYSDSNPLNETTASNLAYIIYTSGSTGKPKGVLVNHTNVTRLFSSTKDLYQFNQQGNQQDVWTMFHSYAFDFSVWEIWGALLHGGRLVVVPYLVTRSPESFYQLLCAEKVTILNQTPSAFRQLIAAEQSIATADDLKLRLIIFGG